MTTGIVTDAKLFSQHKTPAGFPERPERLIELERTLLPFFDRTAFRRIAAAPAELTSLTAVHSQELMNDLREACEGGVDYFRGSTDLPLSPASYITALMAAGSVIAATDEVMAGRLQNAFSGGRPPGHHAFAKHIEGFCFVNNVAVAAQHLINIHGLERVAILDWDLHHGNGTQDIFFRSEKVLFVSIHGDPRGIYPGRSGFATETGADKGEGFNLNVPLLPRSGDRELFEAWYELVRPKLDQFKPQFILISAGFDAHIGDPFKYLSWSSEAYELLTKEVMDLADKHCAGRIVSVLEGGYSTDVLKDVVPRHLEILAGGDPTTKAK